MPLTANDRIHQAFHEIRGLAAAMIELLGRRNSSCATKSTVPQAVGFPQSPMYRASRAMTGSPLRKERIVYNLPPINILMPGLRFEGDCVQCSKVDLEKLLYLILQHVPFDEEWYLSEYPDVKKGIHAGIIGSGADHYRRSGYLEGRLPFEPVVDEAWYCNQYPDVKNAIKTGVVPDARTHYLTAGRFEGRLPSRIPVDAGWYRCAYPKARLRLEKGESFNDEDDFVRFGHTDGFQPFRPLAQRRETT